MNHAPIEQTAGLCIGTVDFVSPDQLKVAVDVDAPESVALNAGTPRPFPRVNGYLLVPVDDGFLVGQVEWMTIERSPFPKRRGMRDFGLIDLPYPLRLLRLNPLGALRQNTDGRFVFSRGTETLPSVGAPVMLPTENQLRSIVESAEQRRVKIGRSPIAGDADVYVDPNGLFGRHLAVLGNTGSGKSCTVAGLIRWSLEHAQSNCATPSNAPDVQGASLQLPNARFIVLDPNGEYSRAFGDADSVVQARIFKVGADSGDARALKVPLWLWNSAEWCSFTQASARTQRPLLRRALREVKSGRSASMESTPDAKKLALRRYLSSRMISIRGALRSGEIQTEESRFGFRLKALADDLEPKAAEFPEYGIAEVRTAVDTALQATHRKFRRDGKTIEFYRAFTEGQVAAIAGALENSIQSLGGIVYQEGPGEDIPIRLASADLADHLEVLATQENVSQYVDFLVARIRTFLADSRMRTITDDASGTTLVGWLEEYIGRDRAEGGCLSIIDLSLVPTDVVHVVTAVIARMVFESLQRYLKLNLSALPTVLVMEEAHTFIKRYRDDLEGGDAAAVCCQVFERIAREGREFGLGLVLSSQRPSKLSPTVLSQCNTFLLHRISNDKDQEMIHRLVPDNLRGLLRELPSLPSQLAIMLGWASELPVMVKMNDLPKTQQPRSDDPEFWDVWTHREQRGIDWGSIVEAWQGAYLPRGVEEGGAELEVEENPSAGPDAPTEEEDGGDMPF